MTTENNTIKRIPTLEELNELLKVYSKKIDYNYIRIIKSIIDLEFSALSKYLLNKEDRELLSNIHLYREAAIYNIYYRAMEIINREKNNYDITIINNNNNYEGITVTGITPEKESFNIYDFNYTKPKPYIKLYKYLQNYTRRDKEIEKLFLELDRLYYTINPFANSKGINKELEIEWQIEHDRKIVRIEEMIRQLESRNKMPAEERYKGEVQNYFSRLFEEEYDIKPKKEYIDIRKTSLQFANNQPMFSELKKEYPSLTLTKEVNYY